MTTPKAPQTFEEKMAELEAILDWFDSNDVTLDKSVQQFERGMRLAEELEKDLSKARNKVEVIKQKFAAGAQ